MFYINSASRSVGDHWNYITLYISSYQYIPINSITGAIKSVSVSANSKFVASGSYDTSVRVWRTATAECLHVLKGIIF